MIRRQLLFSTFDPEVASAYGISTGWTDLVFVLLLAITVLASTQILGVTLVAAAIVIPPVIARYLTRSFHTLLIVSPIIGALCGAVGMFLSYYLDISSAAMIVLTAAALFLMVEAGLIIKKSLTA
jgi:manganese/iron transport system permease protein/iron/zinc/copper transport system permease protein